ncbi:hypothetical protein [Embleya sp. NPDC001921]
MAPSWEFRLDYAGIREILRGDDVRRLVDGVADEIATRVRASVPADAPVEVRRYTTDRGAATVAIADARAMGWQARDGVLTRAAAGVGLEVKQFR